MRAIITTYTKTDNGLILRNNYLQDLEEYNLKGFLSSFVTEKDLEYSVNAVLHSIKRGKVSTIVEGITNEGFVIHIRFIS
jgi:hypothetical protein